MVFAIGRYASDKQMGCIVSELASGNRDSFFSAVDAFLRNDVGGIASANPTRVLTLVAPLLQA